MSKTHIAYCILGVIAIQSLFLGVNGIQSLTAAGVPGYVAGTDTSLSKVFGFALLLLAIGHGASAYITYKGDPSLGFKILAGCGAVLIVVGAPFAGVVTFAMAGGIFWIAGDPEIRLSE